MASLDQSLGWSLDDPTRVLVASGYPISSYYLHQITSDMNYLGELSPNAVNSVLDLLDQYDEIQTRYNELNTTSDARILIKADVLEWEANDKQQFSPLVEIGRIRGLLKQYFGFSIIFQDASLSNSTGLIRS